jgi:hypothetical protein
MDPGREGAAAQASAASHRPQPRLAVMPYAPSPDLSMSFVLQFGGGDLQKFFLNHRKTYLKIYRTM